MKVQHWPLTIFNTLISLMQLFLPIVLVRVLTAEQVGIYKIFFLYTGLFPHLSFSIGVVYGVSFWSGAREKSHQLLQQAWGILSGYALILMLAGLAALPWLSRLFEGGHRQTAMFVLSGTLMMVIGFYEEVWVVSGRIWLTATYRGITEILRCGLMLAAAIVTKNVELVVLAHCAVVALRFLVGSIISLRQGLVAFVWEPSLLTQIWRFALPVSVGGVLNALSGFADQILLSRLLLPAQFAVYSIGCLMVPPLFALEQSVNQVMVPRVAKSLSAGEPVAAAELYAAGVRELARFMIPSVVGLLVFAEPIIRLLFTSKFIDAVPVLRLFAFAYLLSALPADTGPKASGAGGWSLRTAAYKALLSIILTPLFTWWFGVLGALAGVLASASYLRIAGFRYNAKDLGWNYRDFLPLGYIARLAAFSLVLGAMCFFARPFFADSRLWFAVAGGGFFIVYAGVELLPAWRGWRRLGRG